jgi:hypothetical protein
MTTIIVNGLGKSQRISSSLISDSRSHAERLPFIKQISEIFLYSLPELIRNSDCIHYDSEWVAM